VRGAMGGGSEVGGPRNILAKTSLGKNRPRQECLDCGKLALRLKANVQPSLSIACS